MATFKDREVFEFCEKTFGELKRQDNGYFPHKHDKEVFDRAAAQFGIGVDEVDRIYDSYTKAAAELEIMKINRLPKKDREEAMMRKLQDIILNNKDLPFYKIEGEPQEPIAPATDIIEEGYKDLISNVAHTGWTIPLTIDIQQLSELQNSSLDSEKIDEFFLKFYTDEQLDVISHMISSAIDSQGQKKRFEEAYLNFKQEMYSSCLTVLTTILEGVISSFGDDPNSVKVKRICNYHASEEKKNGNAIKSLCWQSIYEYSTILFKNSDFSKAEPDETNRHWLLHGRTNKIGERVDCIRVMNALSTISNLK